MRRMLCALVALCLTLTLTACGASAGKADPEGLGEGWTLLRTMPLSYAENFRVDYYDGGYKLLTLSDGNRYLTVPQGADAPKNLPDDVTVLPQPITDVYMVATAVMSQIDALDALDVITLSGTKADDWTVESARAAMEAGKMIYAGKYSEPDYELILSSGCRLAVESTMIDHSPEVKEKLLSLGIPVLVDQSSLESHPLGRTEWIKFYGALLDREEQAEAVFAQQEAYLKEASAAGDTGKTVAFFYISTSGYAVTRRSGDYVSRMIQLAGGHYVFDDLGDPDSSMSTVSLEMEQFYATAKDADIVIYNSTIDSELHSMDEFLAKSPLLRDFKAVQTGSVWCTGKNLYQDTTHLGTMIADMHTVFTTDDPSLTQLQFLYRLS